MSLTEVMWSIPSMQKTNLPMWSSTWLPCCDKVPCTCPKPPEYTRYTARTDWNEQVGDRNARFAIIFTLACLGVFILGVVIAL